MKCNALTKTLIGKQARLLRRYERAALDAEAALHHKQEELSGCWQAYLGAAGTLPERRAALEGIESALNGSYGLQKTAEAARKVRMLWPRGRMCFIEKRDETLHSV